jgi:hypothetical protein
MFLKQEQNEADRENLDNIVSTMEKFTTRFVEKNSKYQINTWTSADFFPGGAKIFQGGTRTYFFPKNNQKHTIFLKKVQKQTIFGRPRAPLAPSLRTPMNK